MSCAHDIIIDILINIVVIVIKALNFPISEKTYIEKENEKF